MNTRNNIDGHGNLDIRASPSAVTTSYNAPGPIGSIDSLAPDTTFKVFRRIHFFTLSRDSEVRTLKKVMARTCSMTRSSPPGYIYLFHDSRFPSIIRMGLTTRNPESRLAQWKSKCNSTIALVPDALSRPVRRPHRLEHLIHRDLRSTRRPKWCQDCGLVHQEGFEVTEQLALATVRLWTRWMGTEPYDEVGELKPRWKQQIQGPNSPITREELYMVLERG